MKILYLGNSITLHPRAPHLGWYGEWGVAASSPERDYVHVLNKMISQAGKFIEYRADNIAFVERDPELLDLSEFEKYARFSPELVFLRIGENVAEDRVAQFGDAMRKLLAFFREKTDARVYVVGSFWPKEAVDARMRDAAADAGAVYVGLERLQSERWQAIGEYGNEGVAAHPSDEGMRAIAEAMFKAVQADGVFDPPDVSVVPEEEDVYEDIEVTIDGRSVDCYLARVSAMPFNRVWPGSQRPVEQTELAPFLSFEWTKGADFCVKSPETPEDVKIRPLSKGVTPIVNDGRVYFTIREPGQYSLEINGRHNNLHIFADPPEDGRLEPDKATYFFPAGVHRLTERLVLQSGESVYLARGAVVYGEIEATEAANVAVFGRGILDGSLVKRETEGFGDVRVDGLVHFTRCRNVLMDGVILRDSALWTVTPVNCENVDFRGVKVIGMWRYNSDGFDFVNSRNVHVSDCFLRTFDDTVVIKGLYFGEADRSNERMNNENYLVENCVLWCDWGGALEVGAETVADEYRNVVYRNCDIIRNADGAMRLQCGDRAYVHGVLYDDIRIEYSKYDKKSIYQDTDDMVYAPPAEPNHHDAARAWLYCGMWSPDNIPGKLRDVTYRNIRIFADPEVPEPNFAFSGADAEHDVDGVTIESVYYNGSRYLPRVFKNEFVGKVDVK